MYYFWPFAKVVYQGDGITASTGAVLNDPMKSITSFFHAESGENAGCNGDVWITECVPDCYGPHVYPGQLLGKPILKGKKLWSAP